MITCATLTGCRNDPYINSHIDVLNAELLTLESQIYELEFDYERALAELKDAQDEIERLGGDPRPRASVSSQTDDEEEPLDLSPPTRTEGEQYDPIIEMPDEEEGTLPVPRNTLPPPGDDTRPPPGGNGFRSPTDDVPADSLGDHLMTEPVSAPAHLQPADPQVTHVQIDPLRTGGSNFDDDVGDDGITLVLEPRNEAGEFVPLAGPLSIVVLDYGLRREGEAARLGRWELDAQQVERSMINNDLERGVHLRLAWSDRKPTGSKLMVAVRYTTSDGRELEAQRDIFITLPGQFSQRWTPRSRTRTPDRNNDRLDIAREPSETDGASLERRDRRSNAADVRPASFAAERPIWRPYR